MLCANLRGTPPMSAKSVSPFHRGPAYPRCPPAAAGPHEFAAAVELGPTTRAARARGAALPRSSGGPLRPADRVSPEGDALPAQYAVTRLRGQLERGLEEVHEQAHRGIQSRQRGCGFQTLEAAIADGGAHDRAILLVPPSLVVLAIRAAARELDPGLLAIISNGLIHEHAVVVCVQPEQREGQQLA